MIITLNNEKDHKPMWSEKRKIANSFNGYFVNRITT